MQIRPTLSGSLTVLVAFAGIIGACALLTKIYYALRKHIQDEIEADLTEDQRRQIAARRAARLEEYRRNRRIY